MTCAAATMAFPRGLTFELSGRRRVGAWAARRKITWEASRPKCQAGGGPLERRVRRHCLAANFSSIGLEAKEHLAIFLFVQIVLGDVIVRWFNSLRPERIGQIIYTYLGDYGREVFVVAVS